MSRADYDHWNEDADRIWWEEEGKHAESDAEDFREDAYSAADAYAEELAEYDDEQLLEARLIAKWPQEINDSFAGARLKCIEWEIRHRGLASA